MAKYKILGGPHGAAVTIEGKAEGEEVSLSKERAAALQAEGYKLDEVEKTKSSTGTGDK